MIQIKKLLWFQVIALLMVAPGFSQDDLLDDEDEVSQEDVVCIPENLAVPYDKYAGEEGAKSHIRQWYSFGSEHFKNKNYDEALPYLWKVYVNDTLPKYAGRAIGKIAECYFKQKKIDSTLITCYKGFTRFPDQQKLHYYAGFLQKELGKSSCAIPHYEALVAKNPKSQAYLSTLAFLYYKAQDCENSIKLQAKVTELFPDDAKAQETLANYMSACGESSIDLWREACKADPSNLDACREYGRQALSEGLYQESVEAYNNVLQKEQKVEDYKNRASAYENLGQNSNAIKDLNSWLALEPDNADIMLYIAVNYSFLNKFSKANSWISKAIRKKPGYGKPYIIRGELYESLILYCQDKRGGEIKLEDKIAYEEAQKVYAQAKKDVSFKAKAKTKISNLKPFIRTAEDKFMDPNAKIKSSSYSFLVGKSGYPTK